MITMHTEGSFNHKVACMVVKEVRLRYRNRGLLIVFTARAYARAVLGVVILSARPSVRLSVCPSVTRVDCDKTK